MPVEPTASAGAPSPRPRILLADPDEASAHPLTAFLGSQGLDVDWVGNALAMNSRLDRHPADLLVLELNLPGESGLQVCRRLRGEAGPGLILTADHADDTDRIIGLELGADDYLSKPFHHRELLARIRAVLRRRRALARRNVLNVIYEFGGWILDLPRRELTSPSSQMVSLSQGEFRLLSAFVDSPFVVLSLEQLLHAAQGPDSNACPRSIAITISRLRRKLDAIGDVKLIRTFRNQGYQLAARPRRLV